MDPRDTEETRSAPSNEEQVAEVHFEDLDEPQVNTRSALELAWVQELRELRASFARQGVDPDGLLRLVADVEASGGSRPELGEAEQRALDRFVRLSAWARSHYVEIDEERGEGGAHATSEASSASGTEPQAMGTAPERPSLVSSPEGREELSRRVQEAMSQAGLPHPAGEGQGTSSPNATAASAAAPASAATASAGSAPAPALSPASTYVAPVAPAPILAQVAPPSAPAMASYVRGSSTPVPAVAAFQPIVGSAGGGYEHRQAATGGSFPSTSAWAATLTPASAPLYTPRGAIPSYGGTSFGWVPSAAVPTPETPAVPATVTPSSGPARVPTGGYAAGVAPSTATAAPRTGPVSISAWWSQQTSHVPSGMTAPATVTATATRPTVPATSVPMYPGGGVSYSVPTPAAPVSGYGVTGWNASSGPVGIRSSVKNAVDMINPFYSDGYTVERARTFWAEFERITRGMDDDLRMTVFRRCMKGKTGEDWWSHSRIVDFATLRIRFHNRFLCISPPQMMERLTTTKRSRGESVEEWADRICDLCDEASIFDPLMRYQYFLSGIRNSTWTAALQTTMVNSIEEAVTVLLFKNMQIPVERDEDFAEGGRAASAGTSVQDQMMAMMQQMQSMMAQQQQMMQAPRSPRGRPTVAPVQSAPVSSSGESPPQRFVGVSMAADQRTQEGAVVCGRCNRVGHGRAICPRQNGTCHRCHLQGHFSVECTVPNDQLPKKNGGGGGQPRRMHCNLCQADGHFMSQCPLMQTLRNVAAREALNAAPVASGSPAQQ